MRTFIMIVLACVTASFPAISQSIEKVYFNPSDSSSGYYLAARPLSGNIKGVIVLFRGFRGPESMLPETNLPNVAAANDMLTVLASTNQKLYADSAAVGRINQILDHIVRRFSPDTAHFALGAYDYSGMVVLRYAELALSGRAGFPVRPRAVFLIDAPVDLFSLWQRSERQIKKNFYAGSAGDAKFILDRMTAENGKIGDNEARYKALTPVYLASDEPGNEVSLVSAAVRVYFDTDISWQLMNRRNGYDDTNIADGAELIKRLLLKGSTDAQFISCGPGYRSNGARNPSSLGILEPVECVQWLKKAFGIYDANTWVPPYLLEKPAGWSTEVIAFPIDFAPSIPFKGIEDLRFMPGWADVRSEEYWSYAFLWWIEGNAYLDEGKIRSYLKNYYDGLVGRNIGPRKIPADKVSATQVTVKKAPAAEGDSQTWNGTISMLDYMAQRPITLNFILHQKKGGREDRTILFFEVTPRPAGHAVWKSLDSLNLSFRPGM